MDVLIDYMKTPIKIDVSYTKNKAFFSLDPRPDSFRGDHVAIVYGYVGDAPDGNVQNGYWYGKSNAEALGCAIFNLSCLPDSIDSHPIELRCLD